MSDATEAWDEFRNQPGVGNPFPHPETAFKAGFAAGQVAALEDAADAITACTCGSELGGLCENCWWDRWLRARAAELSKEQHDQPDAQFPN